MSEKHTHIQPFRLQTERKRKGDRRTHTNGKIKLFIRKKYLGIEIADERAQAKQYFNILIWNDDCHVMIKLRFALVAY